jgi:hypothetical protein
MELIENLQSCKGGGYNVRWKKKPVYGIARMSIAVQNVGIALEYILMYKRVRVNGVSIKGSLMWV